MSPTTKLVMVGKPEVGKTTIKKVMFEGADPNELIITPLEATIGYKYSFHDFMDSKIALVDSPGQSLPSLLKDEERQLLTFENATVIIYVFDYPTWIEDSEDILDDIRSIYEIIKKHNFTAEIVLFLHKIDLLITKKIGSKLDIIKGQINRLLKLPKEFPIYFTSLHPNLIYNTYNALSNIFGNFSENIIKLKENINKIVNEVSKTICFVINQEGNLLLQEMSYDFDNSILFYLYEKIYKLNKLSEEEILNCRIVDSGTKILQMISENISRLNSNYKYIMFISEILGQSELKSLIEKVKEGYNQQNN